MPGHDPPKRGGCRARADNEADRVSEPTTSAPSQGAAEAAPPLGWLARLFAVYGRRRVAVMLLLGFSSGLPLQLTGSTLQAWLTETGVGVETIGLFGLVGIAYGWKFVWSPAIDGFAIPGLSRLLGHRRAWLLSIQILLMAAIACLGLFDPAVDRMGVAAVAVVVAFLSATQDIAVDALRIESLEESEQAAGTANFLAAYRVAMLVSFAGTVGLVSWIEASGVPQAEAWHLGFIAVSSLVLIGIVGTFLAKEDWAAQAPRFAHRAEGRFRSAVVDPFRDFVKKDAWWLILLFVLLFKLGDAFTTELRTYFFLTMGFEKATYAALQWPFGFFSVIAGGFVGGILANRIGVMKALWIATIGQMATNITFVWPALDLPHLVEAVGVVGADGVKRITLTSISEHGLQGLWAATTLCGTIALENFATGIGGTVMAAYLSKLCSNRDYTATQFALLTSLEGMARVTLAAPAGFVVAYAGWVWYYVIATLLALPGLALLGVLKRREARRAA